MEDDAEDVDYLEEIKKSSPNEYLNVYEQQKKGNSKSEGFYLDMADLTLLIRRKDPRSHSGNFADVANYSRNGYGQILGKISIVDITEVLSSIKDFGSK